MSNDKNQKKGNLVPSGNGEIQKYSPKLISRGLELVKIVEQKRKGEPDNALAYFNRGIAYGNKGQYEQAISDFTKALEINPRDAIACYNRGNAYGDKGQFDQAISDYTKTLEINPRDAVVYYKRARAYYFKRKYEKSWKDVEKAQSLGYQIHPDFLDELRKASGRKN